MKVIWNKRARTNLESIRKYIFKENQEAAKKVVLRIVQATRHLSDMPNIGRDRP